MEDHKLKVFCTVAETKSFSKTSEIIHLTQPAVSLQIQALEEIYETKLFDRSSSTVTLTPAGEVLYKYAKEILSLYANAEKVIGELTGLVKGSISIGASSTIGNHVLPVLVVEDVSAKVGCVFEQDRQGPIRRHPAFCREDQVISQTRSI